MQPGPSHNLMWVKKYCSHNGSVSPLTLYLPHLLLVLALALLLTEHTFVALVKTGQRMESLHTLLVQHSVLDEATPTGDINQQHCLAVKESFHCAHTNLSLSSMKILPYL